MIDRVLYLFSEGIRGLLRTKITAIATIITIGITSSFVMITAQFGENISKFVEIVRGQYELQIFFKENVDEIKALEIINELNAFEEINSTKLITKDQAAKIFEDEFGENIFDVLDYNPLPYGSVVEISPHNDNSFNVSLLSGKILNIDGVDEVRYQGRLISLVERYYRFFYIFLTLISCLILFATIILISNTIRLTIFARKDLIKVLKLSGATNNFIKLPFLLEGIFEGILGSIIASLISFLSFETINYFLSIFSNYTFSWSFNLNLILVFTIIFFSWIGSVRAVKKFI